MVYASAAKKTGAYMVLALVLGLSIVTLLSGEVSPTGRVTSTGIVSESEALGLLPFALGFVVGALVIGTYFYVVHIEKKR